MTKKSTGRQERDKRASALAGELKGNNNWTDLHQQYAICKQMLIAPGAIARALNNEQLLACIDDLDTFTTNIRIVTSDLEKFSNDLNSIYSKHAHRNGSATADNVMEAFALVDEYSGFNVRFETVVMPTILHILEQTGAAETKLSLIHKQLAQAQAANATAEQAI